MKSWLRVGLLALVLSAGCVSPSAEEGKRPASTVDEGFSAKQWTGAFMLSTEGRVQVAGNQANTNLNSNVHNCVELAVQGAILISLVAEAEWTRNSQEPSLMGYTFLKDADGPFRSHNHTTGQDHLRLALDYPANESA